MKTDYAFIDWSMDVFAKKWSVISNSKTSEKFSDQSVQITNDLIDKINKKIKDTQRK